MTFSSVVSLHQNPFTCGVAKFSQQLAQRLGVPMVPLNDPETWGAFPLLSLKWGELSENYRIFTRHTCYPIAKSSSAEVMRTAKGRTYGVFWHDAGDAYVTDHAEHVFYADPSLGSPGLWCPSLITPRKRPVRLFSFGMAHKLQTDKYWRVRELLDAASIRYHLRVSVGLHEGTSLDGAEKHFDALKEIMGPENVTILGILSDEAVSEELYATDCVLAFFEKGLRANNTTVHAALDHDCTVITNHDSDTPNDLRMMTADLSVAGLIWSNRYGDELYSWERLIHEMKGVCDTSTSLAG